MDDLNQPTDDALRRLTAEIERLSSENSQLSRALHAANERMKALQTANTDLQQQYDRIHRDSSKQNEILSQQLSSMFLLCERYISESARNESLKWLCNPQTASHYIAREVWFEKQRWGMPYKISQLMRNSAIAKPILLFCELELGKFLCSIGFKEYGTAMWNRAQSRQPAPGSLSPRARDSASSK